MLLVCSDKVYGRLSRNLQPIFLHLHVRNGPRLVVLGYFSQLLIIIFTRALVRTRSGDYHKPISSFSCNSY